MLFVMSVSVTVKRACSVPRAPVAVLRQAFSPGRTSTAPMRTMPPGSRPAGQAKCSVSSPYCKMTSVGSFSAR